MNIVETIQRETRCHAAKVAVFEGGLSVTYEELLARVKDVSEELKGCGLRPGHRVALLCDDSIDYIVVTLGVLSTQAVVVPVPPSSSREEVEEVVERIDVNFLISDGRINSSVDAHRVLADSSFNTHFSLRRREAQEFVPEEYYRINPAFIRFSSGTTQASKGVVLSHESIHERTDAADRVLNVAPEDIILWVLSMSYHFVVTILLFLRRSTTIVLCPGLFPDSIVQGLKRHKATFMYASPFHYDLLTNSGEISSDSLSTVRVAVSTAMKQRVSGTRDFCKRFGFELTEAYGIIEVGLPCINRSGLSGKRGSVGRVLPDFELKIDEGDSEGVGEISFKGKGLFDAYFSPWQSREEVLSDGWFRTGDVGSLDEEGFLYIVGRKKNLINFAGMKIFPYEVESVLKEHPAIKEALVYGNEHARYGEIPCAKIVLNDRGTKDIDGTAIRRFCYERLAPYKVPKQIHRVDALEKTPSGKLRRR